MTLRQRLRRARARSHARALTAAALWARDNRGHISDEDWNLLVSGAEEVNFEFRARFYVQGRALRPRPGAAAGGRQSTARWR